MCSGTEYRMREFLYKDVYNFCLFVFVFLMIALIRDGVEMDYCISVSLLPINNVSKDKTHILHIHIHTATSMRH